MKNIYYRWECLRWRHQMAHRLGYVGYILTVLRWPRWPVYTLHFQTAAVRMTLTFILKSTVLYSAFHWRGIKQRVRCLNIFECLSLDFCVPKGQDIICLPFTFNITRKLQKHGMTSMQSPVYDFLSNSAIKFFSLMKPRCGQGVGRKEKKLTYKKKI